MISDPLISWRSSGTFLFGTQYYRAPSPKESEWEKDLRSIARLGMNTVKFWVQWRWNNPAEGEYDFCDIDRLMDIAAKNRLRVMLNTIVDVAPAWVYRKYPDASMITLDGRAAGPQTQPHRQIGGLGVCLHHPAVMEHCFDFLRSTVERYSDHPALEIWNVASEPELTQSMAELRLFAGDASRIGDMLCYCDHCRRAFKLWLTERYGTIDRLNLSSNRNYRSFDEVELPKTRNTFNDLVDWRMFFVHTLGENVKRRFTVAREADGGRHPLMCHHVFIQGFPVTSTANDPWNVGQYGDLHGCTQMDDPSMVDVLRSCAPGKPVISAEMLVHFGYTLDLPSPASKDDFKRYIFTGIAANLKGFVFWQYRPEILGREAPAWGLTTLDGSETPWLKAYAEIGRVLQKTASFLMNARPPRAPIGIVYSPENQIFGWAATGNEKSVTDSVLGIHRALYEQNYAIDFLNPLHLAEGSLRNYKVIIVPFPYWLREEFCRKLEEWIEAGGALIGESHFAGWNVEEGCHQTTVPGYGMHRVFGARQRFAARYEDGEAISIIRDLPGVPRGGEVIGSLVKEALDPDRAEVLAAFADGSPAITSARHGKGRAILIGSYIGLPYYRNGHRSNGDVIAGLVESAATIERPLVMNGSIVRVDILSAGSKGPMIIVRNLEERNVDDSVVLPSAPLRELREQFSSETVRLERKGKSILLPLRLRPREVKVYAPPEGRRSPDRRR